MQGGRKSEIDLHIEAGEGGGDKTALCGAKPTKAKLTRSYNSQGRCLQKHSYLKT